MIERFDDKIDQNKVSDISCIKLKRVNYETTADFYLAISHQMNLLLMNNFIVSIFNDILNKEVIIEFSSASPGELKAVPVWMSPEEYIKYLDFISQDDDPYIDDSDSSNNKA